MPFPLNSERKRISLDLNNLKVNHVETRMQKDNLTTRIRSHDHLHKCPVRKSHYLNLIRLRHAVRN